MEFGNEIERESDFLIDYDDQGRMITTYKSRKNQKRDASGTKTKLVQKKTPSQSKNKIQTTKPLIVVSREDYDRMSLLNKVKHKPPNNRIPKYEVDRIDLTVDSLYISPSLLLKRI